MRYESKYDYLQHYGVKGQKHGLRRYQNEDGSLTAEGREHYGVGEKKGGRSNGINDSNSSQGRKEKRPSNQNAGEAKAKKNRDRAKKILAVAAAASLTAVAAYAASKAIKSKAVNLLSKEQARDINRIMFRHDRIRKEIGQDQHYDLLDELRQHTNAELSGTNKYYDSKRESMSRSTLESLRYIRGNKDSSQSSSSARSDSPKRTTSSSTSSARSESPKRTTSSNAANERAMRNLEELRRLNAEREARMNRLDESLARANQAARGGSKKKRRR